MSQTDHNNNLNTTTIIMKPISTALLNNILSQLDAGHSACQISQSLGPSVGNITNICQKHCPNLPMAVHQKNRLNCAIAHCN